MARDQHPAVQVILDGPQDEPTESRVHADHTTSASLARALAIGCLSGLDSSRQHIDIWDPAAGSGYAGFMIADALDSVGVEVRYRGQDVNERAVSECRDRFEAADDAQIAVGNTLTHDGFEDFTSDLVIVDAPWGMNWSSSAGAVEARRESGSFSFGIPRRADSAWLFISLGLEKLRSASEGGGRVAALVNPGALWAGSGSEAVRRSIVDAELLESVTRLPDGLAPGTGIPLYLMTFTNNPGEGLRGKAQVADLQTQFTTEHGRRSLPFSALRELESSLRTGRSGPRNRTITTQQFIQRHAKLSRVSGKERKLSWSLTTYNDTAIDDRLLELRQVPTPG